MPYSWSTSEEPARELRLWPHNSLPSQGFASVILGMFTLSLIPMFTILGSVTLWGILPFVLLALTGTWMALRFNQKSRRILEVLTLTDNQARLVRHNPRGETQEWSCNRHWASPELHRRGGPVPYYVTLRGGGREVEIGAFLSEDERRSLYDELRRSLRAD